MIHKGWPVNLISRAKHQAGHQPCQAECLGYVFLRLVPRDRRGGRVGTFRERSGDVQISSTFRWWKVEIVRKQKVGDREKKLSVKGINRGGWSGERREKAERETP